MVTSSPDVYMAVTVTGVKSIWEYSVGPPASMRVPENTTLKKGMASDESLSPGVLDVPPIRSQVSKRPSDLGTSTQSCPGGMTVSPLSPLLLASVRYLFVPEGGTLSAP